MKKKLLIVDDSSIMRRTIEKNLQEYDLEINASHISETIATPVFASSVTYLMPIVAIFWGVLDGESLSSLQMIASTIILLGVYLSHRRTPKIK